jgi:hypothetical protein
VTDGDPSTFWSTGTAQHVGDALIVDLGGVVDPCAVRFSLGTNAGLFPRLLQIATSLDDERWETAAAEKGGGRTVLAALEHPRDVQLAFPIRSRARYVRLRLEAGHATIPWVVTEVSVSGVRRE